MCKKKICDCAVECVVVGEGSVCVYFFGEGVVGCGFCLWMICLAILGLFWNHLEGRGWIGDMLIKYENKNLTSNSTQV